MPQIGLDIIADQLFGQVGHTGVKEDVPQPLGHRDVHFVALTPQTRNHIEDHQPLDHFRVIVGQIIRNRATPVVAGQADFLKAERGDKCIHV